jgi:uncharacterized protein YkwD
MKQLLSLALGVLYCIVMEARPLPAKALPGTPRAVVTASAVNASMADDILKYVNDYRRRKRLPALAMNSVITAEAQKHSENMAAHRTAFGHNGFKNRMKRILPQINGNGSLAENVAYGSTSAKQVVERWLKSPVHRENIEGPYNLTGIGIATDRSGDLYFTQIFAAK